MTFPTDEQVEVAKAAYNAALDYRWRDPALDVAMRAALQTVEPSPESTRVALWMISHSYATGHGDTVEDMLGELEAQAFERAGPSPELQRLTHEDACILSQYFNRAASLSHPQHRRINEWLKTLIAASLTQGEG